MNARVVYQKNTEHGISEAAITVSVDSNGLIILEQEKNCITVEPESLKELNRAIRQSMGGK
jgi:hypothetical protein